MPTPAATITARTAALTAAALVGFAANSLLCRLALAEREIDAASFTAVRLASGAVVLGVLALTRPRGGARGGGWVSAAALFAYAALFSFAYLRLTTGVGALLLFGAVQATMIAWGLARGERPRPVVWLGLALAVGGLIGLTAPGATAPDPQAALGMAVAGIAWGVYSLRGRTSAGDPVVATAVNFALAVPLAGLLLAAAAAYRLHTSARGVVLAVGSGAVASGLGYSLWYAALRGLTATRAAILQLAVPVVAAAGGVALLGESLSLRLLVAGTAILGGVAVCVAPTRP